MRKANWPRAALTAAVALARSFSDFFDAAQGRAVSRPYGGIHYRPAIADGITQGICNEQKVSALEFRP